MRPQTALLAAACLLAAGCNTSPPETASASATPPPDKTGLLAVTPEQAAHLAIAEVEKSAWPSDVRTTGTVDWNADRTTPAITQVSGPITRILVNTGDAVTAGQPLLYVSSPDVINAISAYRKARNRQDLTRRALARSTDLLEHHALARKDYESAQADFNDATTDFENSLEALKIYGIAKEEVGAAEREGADINPQLAVRAPIAGTVVQKMAAPGQLIQAGATTCFVVSDTSTVWVQGHIFDRDLPSVRVGDPVEETNPSFPTRFHGVVEYIGAMLDPATRTTPVRIVTHNAGGLLKKDMFVDAVIRTRTRRNVLSVPVSAIVRDAQNEPFVFVQVEPGRYARRAVTAGAQQDGRTEIVSGLKEGDPVVAEGSIFLQFAGSQ